MNLKDFIEMDIDQLELEPVTDIEKQRVKNHILKKRKKAPVWKKLSATAMIVLAAGVTTTFAFPSVASQIPFMSNVINYFEDDTQQFTNFATFSNEIGMVQSDNGLTIMIDHAVYDGTNITVSYAIESTTNLGDSLFTTGGHDFSVVGSSGSGAQSQMTKVGENRYVGVETFTPFFDKGPAPDTAEVTWKPTEFETSTGEIIKGDWSFAFSLDRLQGDLQTVNATVEKPDLSFTLNSIEYTDVSTVLSYKQLAGEKLLKKWPSVSPSLYVSDDLGNVYVEGLGGVGTTSDGHKTFFGTTSFGAVDEKASQLIIRPVMIASLSSGLGHKKIELETIIVDIER